MKYLYKNLPQDKIAEIQYLFLTENHNTVKRISQLSGISVALVNRVINDYLQAKQSMSQKNKEYESNIAENV